MQNTIKLQEVLLVDDTKLRALMASVRCGSFSKAAASLRSGGTLMFALLALAGDFGCSDGPTLVGMVAGYFGDRLQTGILAGIIFPVMMILCILFFIGHKSKN